MRLQGISALVVVLFASTALAQAPVAPQPPVAEKIHTEKPINGAVQVDDYAWLRDKTSPKVRAYLEGENAYAEQFTVDEKPFAEKLYKETLRSEERRVGKEWFDR